jgi:uncharacterized membrane protein
VSKNDAQGFQVTTESNSARGVVTILAALSMTLLLGIAALVVDLGLLFLTKYELQNAADAGALAGARQLHAAEAGPCLEN